MNAISWRERANFPLPRAGYAAAAIGDRFIVAGGSYWAEEQKRRTAAVDIFDPATNLWSAGPPLPAALSDPVSLAVDGAFYIIGGLGDKGPILDTLVLRDRKWSVVPGLRLPEAKIRAAGVTDRSHIYVIGGQREFGNESASDQVWMCDAASPSSGWTALPASPAGPHVVSGAAVWSGALYLFGGFRIEKGAGENIGGIWRFDLGRHSWMKAGELPDSRRAFWAAPDDREILLFGGYTDIFSPDVRAFDPRTGSVKSVGVLPRGVVDAKFFKIRNRWYTAGGEVGVKIRGPHTWEGVREA